MATNFRNWGLILFSFLIVAFGQPALSGPLSALAAAVGYGLFWMACSRLNAPRFWLGAGWFAAVQAVQLSWLVSFEYMGPCIVLVYAFLSLAIGIQFGFLMKWIRSPMRISQMLALSGFWVLMEWMRLFFLTGFTWNPVGLALAANRFSIQLASLIGIYGLCFWVIWVNLLFFSRRWILWVICALFPFCYGAIYRQIVEKAVPIQQEMSVALVQTALRPEQRDYLPINPRAYIPPLEQWNRIFSFLENTNQDHFDLIVFPEGTLPRGARVPAYPLNSATALWKYHFDELDFPQLETPFALERKGHWFVNNAFLTQSLANRFDAEIVIGLDEEEAGEVYNAALHFAPKKESFERYLKQILIPLGEYVPLSGIPFLAQFFADQFGIAHSFAAGKEAKIFAGKVPLGVCICLEETYSSLIRELRRSGAELLINITNDVWFPNSRLPWHHFDHGRLRAVENGVCLLRACNTGVTAVVNSLGDPIAAFPVSDRQGGVLTATLPVRSHKTPYTFLGDLPILLLSALFLFSYTLRRS